MLNSNGHFEATTNYGNNYQTVVRFKKGLNSSGDEAYPSR